MSLKILRMGRQLFCMQLPETEPLFILSLYGVHELNLDYEIGYPIETINERPRHAPTVNEVMLHNQTHIKDSSQDSLKTKRQESNIARLKVFFKNNINEIKNIAPNFSLGDRVLFSR